MSTAVQAPDPAFTCDDLRFLTGVTIPAAWVTDPATHRLLAGRMAPKLEEARARGESELVTFMLQPIEELHGETLAHWVAEGLPRVVADWLVKALDYR